jgi:hypothetical protein
VTLDAGPDGACRPPGASSARRRHPHEMLVRQPPLPVPPGRAQEPALGHGEIQATDVPGKQIWPRGREPVVADEHRLGAAASITAWSSGLGQTISSDWRA